MKLGDKGHSRGCLGESWLGGDGGIGRISSLTGEYAGFLVVHCASLSDSR